ncbi:MAG: NAD(P)-binding domain-containing protein, partial [Bacteroidaceae bacterium]|nr:NAD(P)-binding domain-containing protein [Bacteroidaceae bacterium]
MKISIIGAGNMGGATARGIAQGTIISTNDIAISNPSKGKLNAIKADFPDIIVTQDNKECVKDADWVILAVKPWKLHEVIDEIRDCLAPGAILCSMAGGVSIQKIEEMLNDSKRP